MALSILGRHNLENRWQHFISGEGDALFENLKNAPENSHEYEAALEAVIAGLQTDVEVDYPHAAKVSFVEGKLTEQLLGRG